MALSDLAVYSEYAYSSMTEILDQQINLFNAASEGTMVLRPTAHQGDFSDEVLFAKIAGGTVRRRNAYGSGAIASKSLNHLVDTSVKVAAGTYEMLLPPGQFKWIQQNPQVAGAALGQQMAVDAMADMVNTGIGATVTAMANIPALMLDVTGAAVPADALVNPVNMINATAKLGDRSGAVRAWIMHSGAMTELWINAANNNKSLFNYGNLAVTRDPFGRLFIVTDAPNLTTGSGATLAYYSLGLQQAALMVGQNNDYTAMERDITGQENLSKAFQAEWSYNVGVQGFSWDKTTGGKSPTDAAIFAAANWDRYATSIKDMAGVILKTK